ncbi:MAG: DUF6056 family protein [Lachnospiraceae bacterium]|nr:DUF6056 family protein [Lachnospiraceae bacterium]
MSDTFSKKKIIYTTVISLLFAGMTAFVFYMQVRFPYVLEDVDYYKNLSTGGELKSIKDIFQSIPYLMKNGGSLLSLVVLQIMLLIGERAADVLNVFAMLVIAYLISRCSGAKKGNVLFIALPFFLMLSLNSDWQYSYLWEFGIVNYVFPAIPFLVFLYMIIYEVAFGNEKANNALTKSRIRAVLCCLSAFVAAYANAAYGLIIIFVAVLAIILSGKVVGRAPGLHLYISLGCAVSGCIFYLLVSGNFKKVSVMSSQYISFSVFPAVVLALLILAVVLRCGGWLNAVHLLLIGVLCFCVAMRFIIQAIPFVSFNGIQLATLFVSIILFCSLLRSFIRENKKVTIWAYILAGSSFLYTVTAMLEHIGGIS